MDDKVPLDQVRLVDMAELMNFFGVSGLAALAEHVEMWADLDLDLEICPEHPAVAESPGGYEMRIDTIGTPLTFPMTAAAFWVNVRELEDQAAELMEDEDAEGR